MFPTQLLSISQCIGSSTNALNTLLYGYIFHFNIIQESPNIDPKVLDTVSLGRGREGNNSTFRSVFRASSSASPRCFKGGPLQTSNMMILVEVPVFFIRSRTSSIGNPPLSLAYLITNVCVNSCKIVYSFYLKSVFSKVKYYCSCIFPF